jgi:Rieske 2Fe-2S family protein
LTTDKSVAEAAAREHLVKRVAKGLPSSWYRDSCPRTRASFDVFWYGRWIAATRADEIPDAGTGERSALERSRSCCCATLRGTCAAFHNTCRHRGSLLCAE